jgi:hypothetical protein
MRRLAIPILLVAFAGCIGPAHPSLELRELQADPASRLQMPGSERLAHFEREQGNTVEGPQFAHDTFLFGTQAAMEEVLAFYDRELRVSGWTRDDFAVTQATTELRSWGWCRPRKAFRVAIERPGARVYAPDVMKGRTFRTLFDAGLQAVDQGSKCGR